MDPNFTCFYIIAPPTGSRLVELEKDLAFYLLHSRADNTVKKYTTYFTAWERWAAGFQEVEAVPASDKHIALYLVSLLQQGSSCHVIDSVVYGVRWVHRIRGYPDPTQSLSRNVLECAKRIVRPPKHPKEPLTPSMLHSIYKSIGAFNSDLLNLRKFTLLRVSYDAGFLRFDEASHLRKGDFKFFTTHMTMFIEKNVKRINTETVEL